MKRSSVGFTLGELLIALMTVGVLAAILLPFFAQSQRKNYKAMCLSNLKQIGEANNLYMQDWDDTFPFSWGATGPWMVALTPYIDPVNWTSQNGTLNKSHTIWHCPSDDLVGDGQHYISYSTNALVMGGGYDPSVYTWNTYGYHLPKSMKSLAHPAQIVFAGDMVPGYDAQTGLISNWENEWCSPSNDLPGHPADDSDRAVEYYHNWLHVDMTGMKPGYAQSGPDACPPSIAVDWTSKVSCRMISYRHNRVRRNSGFANFAFVDGHVKGIYFGLIRPHNFFPHLTASQIAAYDN